MTTLFSRRVFLKGGAIVAGALTTGVMAPSNLGHAAQPSAGKTLIAYYSRTGNTRAVAKHIHHCVGDDLFELRTTHTYPEEYKATTAQARREQDSDFRPQLTARVENMDTYTVIFIGYPNWWGTLPMAFFTFLESYNFAGKTLVPFCTHEGGALGRGPTDIATLCPDATQLTGFSVQGRNAAAAQNAVDQWLKNMGLV